MLKVSSSSPKRVHEKAAPPCYTSVGQALGGLELANSRENFRRMLRHWLKLSRMTQAGLARELGVTSSQISHWAAEDGNFPNAEQIDRIATVFGIPPSYLIYDKEDRRQGDVILERLARLDDATMDDEEKIEAELTLLRLRKALERHLERDPLAFRKNKKDPRSMAERFPNASPEMVALAEKSEAEAEAKRAEREKKRRENALRKKKPRPS